MRIPNTICKQLYAVILFIAISQIALAHNGTIGYAYPLGNITVDGNFSDWPADITIYKIAHIGSDSKPVSDADFNSSFRIGYRAENNSIYIALQVTDDDFIEDTSANVRWNTQDAVELYLDARHLPLGSGVASFMYSKKLRNTNNAYFDSFAKDAKWNICEVAYIKKGNTRYYEWRLNLGNQFAVGKTIGLDFNVFDLDSDKSFTYNSWGGGDMKYVNPRSLCDVVLMPKDEKLSTISGKINWDKKIAAHLPGQMYITNIQFADRWVAAAVDSLGNYSAQLPAGKYRVSPSGQYVRSGDTAYATRFKQPLIVSVAANKSTQVPALIIPAQSAPDLLSAKGVLFSKFTPAIAHSIDNFIQQYQKYDDIPGVSLAIIKDGKLIYAKTYGVRNTFTKQPVDSNTVFEAASITKPVFAFAVQRLAERGVINLDTPLYKYLPYPDIAYDDRYKLITARHVLTHGTGFPNWRSMNDDGKLDLKFTPGTKFGYSGEGFEYLKLVIEKITGKKVEEVLEEEVIQPMQLWHTFFSRNDSLRQMVAEGHFNLLPNYDDLPEKPGMAYSMHTEAKIFTRFMLYLLEQKGLSPQTYSEMLSKHSEYDFEAGGRPLPKYPTYFGESLEIRETPWGKSFGHGGNNGDFKCTFRVYKDLKMGYALFTNSNTSDVLLNAIGQFLIEGKESKTP